MADEQQLDHAAFLKRFRERAQQRGYDTTPLDDEALIAKIGEKRPDIADQLNLSYRSKVLKAGLPGLVEDARKIGATQRENKTPTTIAALGARVLPGLFAPGVGDAMGEFAAQKMEASDRGGNQRDGVNLPTVAGQAAVGALPWNKVKRLKELAETAPGMTGAIKGAVSSGLGTGAFAVTERGELPSVQEMVPAVVAGGVLGGVANKYGPHVIKFLAEKLGLSPAEAAAKLGGQGGAAPPPAPKDPSFPGPPSPQGQFPGQYGVSTQPPAVPPGFKAEAFMADVRNQNAGMRQLNDGGQPSLPGMPLRRPDLNLEDPMVQQALQASPEGQALFRFMQEGSAGKPYWKQPGVAQPKAARVKPKVAPPVPEPVATPVTPPPTQAGTSMPSAPTTAQAAPEVPAAQPTFRPGTPEAAGVAPAPAGPLAELDAQIAALRVKPGEPHDPARVKRLFALMERRRALAQSGTVSAHGFTPQLPRMPWEDADAVVPPKLAGTDYVGEANPSPDVNYKIGQELGYGQGMLDQNFPLFKDPDTGDSMITREMAEPWIRHGLQIDLAEKSASGVQPKRKWVPEPRQHRLIDSWGGFIPRVEVDGSVRPSDAQAQISKMQEVMQANGVNPDRLFDNTIRIHADGGGGVNYKEGTVEIGMEPAFPHHQPGNTAAHEGKHLADWAQNPDIFKDYPYSGPLESLFGPKPQYWFHPAERAARAEGQLSDFMHGSNQLKQGVLNDPLDPVRGRAEFQIPMAGITDTGKMQALLAEKGHEAVAEPRLPDTANNRYGYAVKQGGWGGDYSFQPSLDLRGKEPVTKPKDSWYPGERGSAPVSDVGDLAALGVGGLAGAAYDPEHPWEGALTGAAMAFAAKRGAGKLLGGKPSGKVVNEALAAWKARGKAIPADDLAATEAWMREGRELLGGQIGKLGDSIQDVAKQVEAGVRLRHPDAFTGKVVEGVEGITPTGQQFVRQNPVTIPKAERIKPGRIPLSRLDNIGLQAGKMPEDVRPTLERLLSDLSTSGELEIQRRGVQPIKLIEQLASRQKVRVDKPGQPGGAYNSEELMAMAYANVGAAKQVDDVLKTQGTPEFSEPKFAEAIMQARATTLTFSGAAAEAGRAMRTLQVIRNVMQIGSPELIQKAIREAGGEQRLRYIAKELSKLPDDIDIRREKLNELLDDGAVRFLERTFQASLLSSARLHLLNSVSNSFNTAYRVGALPFRAAAGEVQGALGKTQGFSWEGVKPATVGLIDGARQGAEAAAYVWKHGITPAQAGGMSGSAEGLNSGRFDVPMPEFRESGYGPWNHVNAGYNKVLRALGAADAFFSTMNTHSARMGIATTVAHNEATAGKLTGDKFRAYLEKRVPEILLKGDLNLEEAAVREGRRAVGQEDLGGIGNMLLAARETPGVGFLIPFVKTTLNFFRQGIELSPAAPLSRQWREAASGTGNPDAQVAAVEQAEAIGRALFGTTALTSVYLAKQAGYLNLRGALPKDPNERARMLNEGRQPYSIEIAVNGKQYAIPFRILGPLSIPLGAMADGFETFETAETESEKADVLRRLATLVSENTAFGQVMDLAEVAQDPKKILNHVSRIVAATLTPGYGLLNDVARGNDQTMREKPDALRLIDEMGWAGGMGTAVTQNMPAVGGLIQQGFTESGKAREKQPLRGPLGDPMERFTPDWVPPALRFAYHAVNPVPFQEIKPEMGKIQPLQKDWEIGPKKNPIKLTIEAEGKLREAKGKATAEALAKLEADPRYRALDEKKRQELRDRLVRGVRTREAKKVAAASQKEAAKGK